MRSRKFLSLARFFSLIGLLGLGACTKSPQLNTPEGVLEEYVKRAFSAKSIEDGKKLLELSTGEAKNWLSSLNEEEFKKQFVQNSMVFLSLKMKDRRQDQGGDVSLVYELSFRDGRGPEPLTPKGGMTPSSAIYTVKKIAYLTRDGEAWKIKATKNVKSFVERKEDLEILTPETTDKNPATETK